MMKIKLFLRDGRAVERTITKFSDLDKEFSLYEIRDFHIIQNIA